MKSALDEYRASKSRMKLESPPIDDDAMTTLARRRLASLPSDTRVVVLHRNGPMKELAWSGRKLNRIRQRFMDSIRD